MTYPMEALGWTLVHFCWQAAAIAMLYRVVDLALAKSRSNVRYVAALAALLSMFAIAAMTLGYEEMRIAGDHNAPLSSAPAAFVDAKAEDSTVAVAIDNIAPRFARRSEVSQYLAKGLSEIIPWLDAMWLAGVLVLSIRRVGGWWLIEQMRRSAVIQVPDSVRDSFDRLCLRIGIRRHIDLRVCDRVSGPLAMGVVRSLILLPASALTSLSPEQLEVVLAHELAHIRRADYLWNMLQTAIETLFFFHPAVWWVSKALRQQRELCCDDVALACCSDPLVFATALLCLEEERGDRTELAMALDGHQSRSGLRTRIVRILGEAPQGRRDVAPSSLIGVCAMLGLFLLPLHSVFADLQPKARVQPLPQIVRAAVIVAPAPDPKVAVDVTAGLHSLTSVHPAIAASSPAGVRPAPVVAAIPKVAPMALQASASADAKTAAHVSYIDQMRAAGYDVDLDKYVGMKIQGVTPEYARSMASLGFGKPTADQLTAMKIHGVTPEYAAQLKASGMEPRCFDDLVSYRIFHVSPEFVAGMKAAGFSPIPANKLVGLRVQGVTPEFAKATRQQYPDVTLDQLVQLRVFHIDEAFLASAKQHGFQNLTIDKLVRLRMSGLLDDEGTQGSEKK